MDVALQREDLYHASYNVLKLCQNRKIYGFVSASTITDIFYLVNKHAKNKETAYSFVGDVLDICGVLTVTADNGLGAYINGFIDFEDSLVATTVKQNDCDCIVTRNTKNFKKFGIKSVTPEELLLNL